jgi:hypothetical protein
MRETVGGVGSLAFCAVLYLHLVDVVIEPETGLDMCHER